MRIIGLVFLALVAVGLLWTGGWFFAARQADAQLDAMIAAERGQGRQWTCEGRGYSGFPLSMVVSCAKLRFVGSAPSESVDVDVAGLRAEASLLHPRQLFVDLVGPLRYITSDKSTALIASWQSMRLTVDGLPEGASSELVGHGLKVEGTFAAAGAQGGTASLLDARFAPVDGAATPSLDFNIGVQGASVPPLDDFLGGAAPVNLALAGRVDHTAEATGATPEAALDSWRRAGGRLALASSRVDRAGAQVTVQGTLALDATHRPAGRLDASFVGLAPVLKRYGISADAAAAASLIGALLGGKPQPAQAPGAINLPVSFNGGRLAIGPIRTDVVLPPVY